MFNSFESKLIRGLSVRYNNCTHEYKDDGTPPPYMSEEFKARRFKALKQVKELG